MDLSWSTQARNSLIASTSALWRVARPRPARVRNATAVMLRSRAFAKIAALSSGESRRSIRAVLTKSREFVISVCYFQRQNI